MKKNWSKRDEEAITNSIIGKVMKKTGGKANPVKIRKIVEKMFKTKLYEKNK